MQQNKKNNEDIANRLKEIEIQKSKMGEITTENKKLKDKMIEHAEPWRPYRTIACRYLWRWKDSVG